jgi:hypothetical protein
MSDSKTADAPSADPALTMDSAFTAESASFESKTSASESKTAPPSAAAPPADTTTHMVLGGRGRDVECKLETAHAFGMAPGSSNIAFLGDDVMVHHVGRHVCVARLERDDSEGGDDDGGGYGGGGAGDDRNSMAFLNISRGVKEVLSMSVSANLQQIALCERIRPKGEEKGYAQVSTYSPPMPGAGRVRPRKGATLQCASQGEFVASSFTFDNKFMVAIGDAPDCQLVCWKMKGQKLIATTNMHCLATKLRVNPKDAAHMTTSGDHHLRSWRLEKDLSLKSVSILSGKREQMEMFRCVDTVAATTVVVVVRGHALCCAVLCCAVLCCAVLCCAVLCCAVLRIENSETNPLLFSPSF